MKNKSTILFVFLLFILFLSCNFFPKLDIKTTPDMPKGLKVVDSTESSLSLSWNRVKGADGYKLYRSISFNGEYDYLNNIKGNRNNIVISNNLDTEYFFRVCAYNSIDESDLGKPVSSFSNNKQITTFRFESLKNIDLENDIDGIIDETNDLIYFLDSINADITNLIVNFLTNSIHSNPIRIEDMLQISNLTENNFTSPVIYTVAAKNESIKDYTVVIDDIPEYLVFTDESFIKKDVFLARKSIEAGPDVIVTDMGNVIFKAGEKIVLNPGVIIDSGSKFVAEVDPRLK